MCVREYIGQQNLEQILIIKDFFCVHDDVVVVVVMMLRCLVTISTTRRGSLSLCVFCDLWRVHTRHLRPDGASLEDFFIHCVGGRTRNYSARRR